MLQASSLHDHWQALKGDRPMPARHEIDPSALGRLLPSIFLLDVVGRDLLTFRIAGSLLSEIHARELKGENFLALFQGDCRRTMRAFLENLVEGALPGEAETILLFRTGEAVRARYALLPLSDRDGARVHVIGSLTLEASATCRRLGPPSRHWLAALALAHERPAAAASGVVLAFPRPRIL